MYVRLSKLRKVVAEQAQHLFEELKQEDRDRLRRGAPGEYSGESHTGFEEAIELEDFEFGEAKKKDEDEPEEDNSSDQDGSEKKEKPAFLKGKGKDEPKKKSPPKEKEPEDDVPEDSGEDEEQPKKDPSPKHKKAKKGLEKAQKQKSLPKTQVDPKSGRKQELDLDQLAQLATEMGYRLERNEPEDQGEDEMDFDLGDDQLPGDDDEMDFDLGSLSDLGGEDEEGYGEDVEGEDVALFSSDEDLGDVMGLGHSDDEDEIGLEGHPLSMKQSMPAVKQGMSKQGGLKLRIK